MKITFLGTGTSQGVPVIACDCLICRSADSRDKRLRSSLMMCWDDRTVVIDTGPDFRAQMLRAEVNRLDAILMTHPHKDHIAGLDDVRAFNRKQGGSIPIYGSMDVHHALQREFYYAFHPQAYFGVPQLELIPIEPYGNFILFDREIVPIEVMHYKMPVMGFRVGDFAYITDAKTIDEQAIAQLKGVRILVLNALQKQEHISHMTLDEAVQMARKIGAQQTYLTHISHFMGLHADVQAELPEGIFLAWDGLEVQV